MTLNFVLRVRNASLGEYLGIVSNPIGMLTKPNKGVMNGLQYHPQSTYHRRLSVSMAPFLANVTTRSNTNKQHHTTQANNTLSTHSSKHVCDPRHVSNVCKQCCFLTKSCGYVNSSRFQAVHCCSCINTVSRFSFHPPVSHGLCSIRCNLILL